MGGGGVAFIYIEAPCTCLACRYRTVVHTSVKGIMRGHKDIAFEYTHRSNVFFLNSIISFWLMSDFPFSPEVKYMSTTGCLLKRAVGRTVECHDRGRREPRIKYV